MSLVRSMTTIGITLTIFVTVPFSAETQPNAGTPSLITNIWKWADVPETLHADWVSGIAIKGHPMDKNKPGAKELSDYLNQLADKIDSQLRNGSKFYDFNNIPKPHVMVLEDSDLDAIAVNAPVCLNVPVRFPKYKVGKKNKIAAGVSINGNKTIAFSSDPRAKQFPGQFTLLDSSGLSENECVQKNEKLTTDKITSLSRFLAEYTSCPVSVYSDGAESGLELKCEVSPDSTLDNSPSYTGANRLLLKVSSNWITFTTGLLATMENESAVVFTLAHEMSHFYSAHLVEPSSNFGYFYSELPTRKSRPNELKNMDSDWILSLDSLAKERYNFAAGVLQKDFKIASPLILPSIDLTAQISNESCNKVQGFLKDGKILGKDGLFGTRFPHEALRSTLTGQYIALEGQILACLESIKISKNLVQAGPGEVTDYTVTSTITRRSRGFRVSQTEITENNAKDVILKLSANFEKGDVKLAELFKKEREISLGHYSFEQDADEKALQILDFIGMSPYPAIEMILKLGMERQKEIGLPYPPIKSASECLSLYDPKNLTWASTDYPYVHLGKISDPHHQYCYRARNIFDRNAANQYTKIDMFSKPENWDKFKKISMDLNPQSNLGMDGGFPIPGMKFQKSKNPNGIGKAQRLPKND